MGSNGSRALNASSNFEDARREMVARQIRARDIRSQRILDAMQAVPRHLFVAEQQIFAAYADEPLPIGAGQTISQPFMVAAMAEALEMQPHEGILEIGTGSGYQAAVLSLLAREVLSIEAQPELAASARERLTRLGYPNVRVEQSDGSLGWPEGAPYDAILVTAAAPAVPPPLIEQLAEGGRLVIPVGPAEHQNLLRLIKHEHGVSRQPLYACRFVPLVGRYGWSSDAQEATAG